MKSSDDPTSIATFQFSFHVIDSNMYKYIQIFKLLTIKIWKALSFMVIHITQNITNKIGVTIDKILSKRLTYPIKPEGC